MAPRTVKHPILFGTALSLLLAHSAAAKPPGNDLQQRVSALEAQNAAQQTEIDALQSENAAQAAQIGALSSTSGALAGEVEALGVENAEQQAQIDTLGQELARVEADVACAPPPAHCLDGQRRYTFNVFDPATAYLDLFTGRAGVAEVQNAPYGHTLANYNSHLRFLAYPGYDVLEAGIQGGQSGALVDLGTEHDLEARLGQSAYGTAFENLRLNEARDTVVFGPVYRLTPEGQYEIGPVVELAESQALFGGQPSGPQEVKRGHVYLARIASEYDAGFQILVKMHVTGHEAGATASIRYRVMFAECGSYGAQHCTPAP